jgi:CHAT domain-containing protein
MRLEPLPEAETEVRALARLYGRTRSRVYVGRDATESALKSSAVGRDVIHVAAHAVLDDEQPFYSSVVLAREGDDDGLLEAWEVRDMDLDAELVVLSACQTGRGRVTPGEGVVGLSWALFAAGVPAAVVSRWNVESSSTAEMMVEFHRQLLSPGASKAEALRRAARRLLRKERFRHPYYWAGFVALGAAGP